MKIFTIQHKDWKATTWNDYVDPEGCPIEFVKLAGKGCVFSCEL